jgi:predicted O-methyltransferase YrrM
VDFLKSVNGEDEEVLGAVRDAWGEGGRVRPVDVILAWTRKHIPYLKRQIAPYQGAALAYFAHLYNRPGARFLEIGTAIGYSACLMATAAPRAMITTLNPKEGEFDKAVKNLSIRSNVRVVKQTSQEFYAPSPRPSPSRERGYDLIFVDGDHAYNMVLHDAQFLNHLRTGGLILFHDYSPEGSARPSDGCYRALNDLAEERRPFDVLIVGSGQVGMAGWIRQEGEVWD